MLLLGECFPGWRIVKRAVSRRSKNRRLKNRRREKKDKGPPNFNPIYDDHCWFDTPPSTPRAHPISAMARAMGNFKQRSLRLARGGCSAPSPNDSPFHTYTASTEGEMDVCRDIDDTAFSTFRAPAKPVQSISCDRRAKDSPPQRQKVVDAENLDPNRLGNLLSPRKSGLSVIGEGEEGKSLETSSAGCIDDSQTVDSSSHALPGKQPFDHNIPESVDTSESVTLESCSSEESVDEPEGVRRENPFEGSKLGFNGGQNIQENGEEHWEADIVPAKTPWESNSVILRI